MDLPERAPAWRVRDLIEVTSRHWEIQPRSGLTDFAKGRFEWPKTETSPQSAKAIADLPGQRS
jgi:hypothetical protein